MHKWQAHFFLCALAICISGCGFTPLYADKYGDGINAIMSRIDIAPAQNREVQHLRNALYVRLNPRGAPLYHLSLRSESYISNLAVERDSRVTRANYRQNVSFALTDKASGRAILTGRSSQAASFNKVASQFANESAERDAQMRTAKAIARDVALQIALALKAQQPTTSETGKTNEGGK